MKKQIWTYLRSHPKSTHHQIASALHFSELDCCKALLDMQKDQQVLLTVCALGTGQDSDCSNYFSTIGTTFPQKVQKEKGESL